MLNLFNVTNSNISEIKNTDFDIGIFASGYERRATYTAKKIGLERFRYILIFGFNEFNNNEVRKINDAFYTGQNKEIILLYSNEETRIYKELHAVVSQIEKKDDIKVLIDYTSMSRLWYAGILNFFRFQNNIKVSIYLTYSIGKYSNENLLDYTYREISAIPSHEGSLSANLRTLLVIGIGYSPYLVKAVIEDIEPNHTLGIIANNSPNDTEDRYQIKEILFKDINNFIQCPIHDLEYIFRTYAEIVSNNIHEKDILFLSLGPKILTVASILVSQRFEHVSCLFLKHPKNPPRNIDADGEIVCSKIIYQNPILTDS